ncbi:hypothetical protein TNCV_2447511 [Trichonephila clavipes]|uniref:Uncharacterized protein n=1 Tax=Trichonephila clavipes TaxID=2585209 RepID=A0A8X6VMX9_TRICX|nr:hypothetical protein TNCV_2447511 [Trichonephila clavipes]
MARCTPIVSRSFEQHSADSTFWLDTTQILRENTLGVIRAFHLSFSSANLTRGLKARWLFRVRTCCKDAIHLQTPMSYTGFKPRSYGIAVSVSNHHTRWVTT